MPRRVVLVCSLVAAASTAAAVPIWWTTDAHGSGPRTSAASPAAHATSGAPGTGPKASAGSATAGEGSAPVSAATPTPAAPAVLLDRETFEEHPVADTRSAKGGPVGWYGWTYVVNPGSADYRGLAGRHTTGAMNGRHVLRVAGVRGVSAGYTSAATVSPGLTYTVTTAIGRSARTTGFGVRIRLTAGGRTVATRDVTRAAAGGAPRDVRLAWTATQALAGTRLGVTYTALRSGADGTTRAAADLDDVRLTATGTASPVTGTVVTAPAAHQVLQRRDDGTTTVTVRVTSPAGSTLQARFVVRRDAGTTPQGTSTGWVSAAGGSHAALTVHGLRTGWYDLVVRTSRAGSPTRTTVVPQVGVGEVFLVAGQSNSANSGRPRQDVSGPRESAPALGFAGWQRANDPQPNATGVGGSPWPEFLDTLSARHDVPVAVVSVGYGGTAVGEWLPGGLLYPRLTGAVAALGRYGFRAVLWHQGEADSRECTSAAEYARRTEAVIGALRQDTGRPHLPWLTATVSAFPGASSACRAGVRAGQEQARTELSDVFRGPDTDSYVLHGWVADGIHFDATGLHHHGLGWAAAVADAAIVP